MAARSPRKHFANPFVVTLAALPACFTSPSPGPSSSPQVVPAPQPAQPGGEPVVVTNPPPPPAKPSSGGTAQPVDQKPQTYAFDQRWTVSKTPTGCQAMARVECPKPKKAGDPVPTCNPPPPMKVACPDNWNGVSALTIVQHANQAECYIEGPPVRCPKDVMCNPPPPRRVACPTYQ